MYSNRDKDSLTARGLKITPQRIAVLDALNKLKGHPSAEKIISYIQKNHPNIASGTVYKILDMFIEKGMIKKVKTDMDSMRYDSILEDHHHLYCSKTEQIEDYFDDELSNLIERYFKKKKIPNFIIEDIKLQLIGQFVKKR
jgi:Fur family transcriptional regulator, peroxide stress response regulator